MTKRHDFIDRSVYVSVQIDANRINSRQTIDAVNRLEQWHRDDIIELWMSAVAQLEATQGDDRARRKKAFGYMFSETLAETEQERARLSAIECAIFPKGARTASEQNDVEIVFNADKYQAILVTADGGSKRQPRGILGSRRELDALGVRVMTAEEAVQLIAQQIAARDRNILEGCYRLGITPPPWVGQDAPEYSVDFQEFVRDRTQDDPVIVKCFGCNGDLATTLRQLRAGQGSQCPSCAEDLRPRHQDETCSLCRGEGVLIVNGAVWVCTLSLAQRKRSGIEHDAG